MQGRVQYGLKTCPIVPLCAAGSFWPQRTTDVVKFNKTPIIQSNYFKFIVIMKSIVSNNPHYFQTIWWIKKHILMAIHLIWGQNDPRITWGIRPSHFRKSSTMACFTPPKNVCLTRSFCQQYKLHFVATQLLKKDISCNIHACNIIWCSTHAILFGVLHKIDLPSLWWTLNHVVSITLQH